MPVDISGCRSLDMTVDGVETTGHGCTVQVYGSPAAGAIDDCGNGTCTMTIHLNRTVAEVNAVIADIAATRLMERTPVTADHMRRAGFDDVLEAMARALG